MNAEVELQLALEDVLANLWHARRAGDLGRLARLSCSEVQGWARAAREGLLSARCRAVLADCPYESREDFIVAIDAVIDAAERAHCQLALRRSP